MERKQLLLVQVIITALIFLIFTTGVLITAAYVLPYLLFPLIIANIVFIFINKTKGLFINISLLLLTSLLFVFLVEYFASIMGMILSFIHALKITLKYFREKQS